MPFKSKDLEQISQQIIEGALKKQSPSKGSNNLMPLIRNRLQKIKSPFKAGG